MENKHRVTIDAAWFAQLWKIANEADEVCKECVREKCGECKVVKERDELKAKLEEAKKHYCTNATGELGKSCGVAKRCQELEEELKAANATNSAQADQLRDALNEVEKLKAKLEAEQSTNANIGIVYAMKWKNKLAEAERCIEEIEPLIGEFTVGDCYPHGPAGEKMLNIIRAYREKKEAAK